MKEQIILEYNRIKDELGRQPSSREFYDNTNISERKMAQAFGSNAFSKLVVACGGDPNVFGTDRVPKEDIFSQWGEILRREQRLPTQADWLLNKCRPATNNLARNHDIKWTDLPALFFEFAKDKPEWSDVFELLPKPQSAEKNTVPSARNVEKYENFVPPIVADLIELSANDKKSLEFEQKVNLIFQLLGFDIQNYGQGTGRNPDGIAKARQDRYGIIIDAKSRTEKYTIGSEDRKFIEYIRNHAPTLKDEGYEIIYFLVVSSDFSPVSQVAQRNIAKETNVTISCLRAADLLRILAARIRFPNLLTLKKFQDLLIDGGVISTERVNVLLSKLR